MKRRDLIKTLTDMSCLLVRHGAKHDWYLNPQTRDDPNQYRASMKSMNI